MFTGDNVLEILQKEIADGLYGSYKLIKDKDTIAFELHYVEGDIINFNDNSKPDFKEAVDKALEDNEDQGRFRGTLRKIDDNKYIFLLDYGSDTKTFEFSFVKEEGKWVKQSIVLE